MKKHVIIGTSAAGISAANTIRTLDSQAEIIMISDEQDTPYNKCRLADYCAGIIAQDQVYTLSSAVASTKNITLMLATRVVSIIPDKKMIVTHTDQQIFYDTLFIGTGSSPMIPAIPGLQEVDGVFPFHALKDIHAITAYIFTQQVRNVVVIGSGLTGLEAADTMVTHKLGVSIVEMGSRVLQSHITHAASLYIQKAIANSHVALYTQDHVVEILHAHKRITAVRLASGKQIVADMIIIASGVRPNVALAEQAGVALAGSGILVNDAMQTSCEYIYAGGDAVMVKDQLTGRLVQSCMWPDAMLQGLVAAHGMVGKHKVYPGVTLIASSSFFGIKFAACGVLSKDSCTSEIVEHSTTDFHHTYVIDGDKLKGFSLIGNIGTLGQLKRIVLTKQSVMREQLLRGF